MGLVTNRERQTESQKNKTIRGMIDTKHRAGSSVQEKKEIKLRSIITHTEGAFYLIVHHLHVQVQYRVKQ